MENLFTISKTRKSAWDRISELLYKHSYCIENASITTIPIYYLEPNTRITVNDPRSGISSAGIQGEESSPGKLLNNMASVYLHELQNHCGW